jgi:predicted nucleic acid-binding protein
VQLMEDLKPRKIAKELWLDTSGSTEIVRLAHNMKLIDRDELEKLVEKLHDILYFTEELGNWVLNASE